MTPTVVAGLYGVGRGQDKRHSWSSLEPLPRAWALALCSTSSTEFLKRLAAASSIDYLDLIKSPEAMQAESDQAKQDAMTSQLVGQAGQLANHQWQNNY